MKVNMISEKRSCHLIYSWIFLLLHSPWCMPRMIAMIASGKPFKNVGYKHSRSLLLLCYYSYTVYPKEYAHGFVVLCFVVVMQSFIMNSHEVFIHIHQGCFAGTGAIVRLSQCQWSKPDWYGKISQCITTTKHSKAKTVCIFLGVYCIIDISQFLNVGIFNSECTKTWYIATMKKVKQHPYAFDMVFCMLHLALHLSHRWAASQGSH